MGQPLNKVKGNRSVDKSGKVNLATLYRNELGLRKDFAVPLTHPLFDPTAPYITIPLYMAHPFPPPVAATTAAPVVPPTSPPQQVPSISHSDEDDPLEATSSSSSTVPSDGYAPANASMAYGFLSSDSI